MPTTTFELRRAPAWGVCDVVDEVTGSSTFVRVLNLGVSRLRIGAAPWERSIGGISLIRTHEQPGIGGSFDDVGADTCCTRTEQNRLECDRRRSNEPTAAELIVFAVTCQHVATIGVDLSGIRAPTNFCFPADEHSNSSALTARR